MPTRTRSLLRTSTRLVARTAAMTPVVAPTPLPRCVPKAEFTKEEAALDHLATHLLYGPRWWGSGPVIVHMSELYMCISDGDDWYLYSPTYESRHECRKALKLLLRVQDVTVPRTTRISPEMIALGWRKDD